MPVRALSVDHDHVHELIPKDDFTRPDGIRTVWSSCICGLEEKRFFRVRQDSSLAPFGLEYRLGGVWMTAVELMRRRSLPVEACPVCLGEGGACQTCRGVGAVEGGGPIALRAPAPISEPQPPVEDDSAPA